VSRAEELKRGSWWLLCRDSGKMRKGVGVRSGDAWKRRGGPAWQAGRRRGPGGWQRCAPGENGPIRGRRGVARGPAGKERKRKMGRAQRNSKLFFLFKIFQLMKGIWIFKFARFLICFKNLIRIHLNFTLAYLELMTSRFNF
jgi:hypothetical protein